MNDKISKELQSIIKDCGNQKDDIQVIVSYNYEEKIDKQELEKAGLKIENEFENIKSIAGVISSDKISELAEINNIVSIEFDSVYDIT